MWILALLAGCDLVDDNRDPADGCASEPIGEWFYLGGLDSCFVLLEDGRLCRNVGDSEDGEGDYRTTESTWENMEPTGDGGVWFDADGVEWEMSPSAQDGLCPETNAGPWDVYAGGNWATSGPCPRDLELPVEGCE